MRILVTGSRAWTDEAVIHAALDAEYDAWLPTRTQWEQFTVVHGKAPGADRIARAWAWAKGGYAKEEGYDAHWDLLGVHAGHERNARMVAGGADKCLAFPLGGPGTRNCIKQARAAGIPVQICRIILPTDQGAHHEREDAD